MTNSTGWPSTGFAFILAVMNGVFFFLGTDCSAYHCEEIANPSRNIPKAILYPVLIGLLASWPFAVALVASISDVSGVINGENWVSPADCILSSHKQQSWRNSVARTFCYLHIWLQRRLSYDRVKDAVGLEQRQCVAVLHILDEG
jgi:amino acid transporter